MEEAARKAAAGIDGAFEGDAHAFLQAVYKNPDVPLEVRIMAAGRALRVEKPVLTASHSQVEVNFNLAERVRAGRMRAAALPRHDEIELEAGTGGPPLLTHEPRSNDAAADEREV